jgi:hypothetical protein
MQSNNISIPGELSKPPRSNQPYWWINWHRSSNDLKIATEYNKEPFELDDTERSKAQEE